MEHDVPGNGELRMKAVSCGARGDRRLLGKPITHLLLIVVLGFIVYSNTFHAPFVFDDERQIVENPVIRDVANFFSNSTGYDYNPRRFIGYLTLALNYKLGGMDVTGYHIFNVSVHIVNALLVYALLSLTFKTEYMKRSSLSSSSGLISFFTAALFLAHPLQTEAVTYIVQRLTSLSTMFYLTALCLYVKWRLLRESGRPKVGKGLPLYILSLGSIVLAMKTKENAFTLPFILVLYEFFFFRMPARKRLPFLLPILLTLLIVPLSMVNLGKPLGETLSDVSQVTRAQTEVSRWDYLLTQFRVIMTYIRLLILPIKQNLDYDYPVYRSFFMPPVFLSFLALLALFGLGVFLFQRSSRDNSGKRAEFRLISFGIFWFFLTLSVESSVIPIADVIFEHRLYLPSVGFIGASVAGLTLVRDRMAYKKTLIAAAFVPLMAAIVLLLGWATFSRNALWNDARTLWQDVVNKSPSKARAHYNLGRVYEVKGDSEEAVRQYEIALGLEPALVPALVNLGNIYGSQQRAEEAMSLFRRATELDPDDVLAHSNLGVVYAKKGWSTEAVSEFKAALRIRPGDAAAHNNLANVYSDSGYLDDAVREYVAAINAKPDFSEAYNNLGLVYARQGLLGAAARAFEMAIHLQPGFFEAHSNLGKVYLKQGNAEGATQEYLTALGLRPEDAEAHANLGVAYLSQERLGDALKEFQAVLNIVPGDDNARHYLEIIEKRMRERGYSK